jgi:hypothetical protein
MVRRTIATGAFLLVALLLVFGFKGCLDARKERAMEDYVRDANELLQLSDAQSERLFGILSAPDGEEQSVDRQNQANELRVESETIVDRARDLDVPGELQEANDYFLESLELRRDSLAVVADRLPDALADEDRRSSTEGIAGVMRVLLASDVLLISRYDQALEDALAEQEVSATRAKEGTLTFVEDVAWVEPDFVADQIAGIRGSDGTATPGLHGNGLGTVSVAGVTLAPGSPATVPLSSDAAFDVQVVNQGDSTETDVTVTVSLGQGGDALELEETITEIAAGELKTATIPLSGQPPTGQNVPITVRIKPVPGEEVTDNNEAEFTVIFTR